MNPENMTGYPSIDKPWLKYYSEEAIHAVVPDKTMYQFIFDNNKDRLDNVAIHYFNHKITYGTFFHNVQKAARAFCAYGLKEGDIVSILSLHTPETQYAIYALNYIGVTVNLLSISDTYKDITDALKSTNSRILLVWDKILEKLGEFDFLELVIQLSVSDSIRETSQGVQKLSGGKSRIKTYNEFLDSKENIEIKAASSGKLPAVIIYTRGTTGRPKGVVLSNDNLNAIATQCDLSGKNYKPEESFFNSIPPFIGFGISMLHLCLYTGMTEIPSLVPQAEQVVQMIGQYKPNRFVFGPMLTDVIEKYPKKDLSFMVDITSGGEALTPERERLLNEILKDKKASTKYLAGYGMTEICGAVSMSHNSIYKEQSVGIPLVQTVVKVIDGNSGEELGYNQEGELLVSSPGLMVSYFHNEEETNQVIKTDADGTRWMHTGDLAKIDEEGFVFITGRLKRLYIIQDNDLFYELFPQQMEELIEQEAHVLRCGVVVLKDKIRQYAPYVFLEIDGKENKEIIRGNVRNLIEQNLPAYYQPKEIYTLKKLPMTASQKIDYKQLEDALTS